MRIAATYSHINGFEYLLVHKPGLWPELQNVIEVVNAGDCTTKVLNEIAAMNSAMYSARMLRRQFRRLLRKTGWQKGGQDHWLTRNEKVARMTVPMTPQEQRQRIVAAEEIPIRGRDQSNFIKDRVAVEVQFGRSEIVAHDLFVRHPGLFISDRIDVGIEILPMKSLQSQMSSGVAYYEGEIYNVVRQGRSVPAVPLVLIGIEP